MPLKWDKVVTESDSKIWIHPEVCYHTNWEIWHPKCTSVSIRAPGKWTSTDHYSLHTNRNRNPCVPGTEMSPLSHILTIRHFHVHRQNTFQKCGPFAGYFPVNMPDPIQKAFWLWPVMAVTSHSQNASESAWIWLGSSWLCQTLAKWIRSESKPVCRNHQALLSQAAVLNANWIWRVYRAIPFQYDHSARSRKIGQSHWNGFNGVKLVKMLLTLTRCPQWFVSSLWTLNFPFPALVSRVEHRLWLLWLTSLAAVLLLMRCLLNSVWGAEWGHECKDTEQTQTGTEACTHIHACMHRHACMHTHTSTHIHSHTHACVRTHTHTRMHTHTHTPWL